MFKRFRTYLIIGVIALLPTLATLYILKLLFGIIDPTLGIAVANILDWLGILEFPLVVGGIVFQTHIPGVGTILTLLLLAWFGMITRSFVGTRLLRYTDYLFYRIPLARTIYSTVKQITSTFEGDQASFKKVVLVPYPRHGIYTMGFFTGDSSGEVQEKGKEKEKGRILNIFLPTTPNPTSGWLVMIPEEDVIFLEMTVEQGLKYIISGGVVTPTWPVASPGDSTEQKEEKVP
ncbi:DUF502 domain-containing protein [Desmospora activa]|uniref:Putative membrane protein n=1 Tax=Desmospora activa DSM 45169 TaxID=1121389 RepID=A0A2T4ZC58_9BACL|nr:DUF502 domain-containing protein [Desmospora activa]PTM59474.1 putative membrane protein [Desmospora activa DSM 45169]